MKRRDHRITFVLIVDYLRLNESLVQRLGDDPCEGADENLRSLYFGRVDKAENPALQASRLPRARACQNFNYAPIALDEADAVLALNALKPSWFLSNVIHPVMLR
jgi:hypothetical protein